MAKKINRQQLFLEFISVVFAVLLALFLNQWRESMVTKSSLAQVKNAIKSEIINNDSLIRTSRIYRKSLLDNLYNGRHLVSAFSMKQLPEKSFSNLKFLEDLFRESILFGNLETVEKIEIKTNESDTLLIIDKKVYRLKAKQDTLRLFGTDNLRLKVPDVINNSWDVASATGTLDKMDVKLVQHLSASKSLLDAYRNTCNQALEIVYSNDNTGIISVLEDMIELEKKIIATDSVLLKMLQ